MFWLLLFSCLSSSHSQLYILIGMMNNTNIMYSTLVVEFTIIVSKIIGTHVIITLHKSWLINSFGLEFFLDTLEVSVIWITISVNRKIHSKCSS